MVGALTVAPGQKQFLDHTLRQYFTGRGKAPTRAGCYPLEGESNTALAENDRFYIRHSA
jgi:hypothetical protein